MRVVIILSWWITQYWGWAVYISDLKVGLISWKLSCVYLTVVIFNYLLSDQMVLFKLADEILKTFVALQVAVRMVFLVQSSFHHVSRSWWLFIFKPYISWGWHDIYSHNFFTWRMWNGHDKIKYSLRTYTYTHMHVHTVHTFTWFIICLII